MKRRTRQKYVFTPEERQVQADRDAKRFLEVTRKIAAHIRQGSLESARVAWDIGHRLQIELRATEGKSLATVVEDRVVGVEVRDIPQAPTVTWPAP